MRIKTRRAKKRLETKDDHTHNFTHAARIATVAEGVIRTTWMCVCVGNLPVMLACWRGRKTSGETDGLCLRLRASGRGGFHLLLMVQPRAKRTRQRFALKTEQYAYSPGVRQKRIRTRDESAESKTGMPGKKGFFFFFKKGSFRFQNGREWEGVGALVSPHARGAHAHPLTKHGRARAGERLGEYISDVVCRLDGRHFKGNVLNCVS